MENASNGDQLKNLHFKCIFSIFKKYFHKKMFDFT